jgi:DNA-binding response OmpR family regulator
MSSGKRILLVDCDEAFLEALSYVLREGGHEVAIARDGNEALAKVEQFMPDLMVIEGVLPRRSGYAVLSALHPAPFPVVFTSNSLASGQKQWAADLGVQDYFRKPFAMTGLVAAIERRLAEGSPTETCEAQLAVAG